MTRLFQTKAAYLLLLPLFLLLTLLMLSGLENVQYHYVTAIYVYAILLCLLLQLPLMKAEKTYNKLLIATIAVSIALSVISVKYGMLIVFILLLFGKKQEEQKAKADTQNRQTVEIRQRLHYSTATVLLLAWIITQ